MRLVALQPNGYSPRDLHGLSSFLEINRNERLPHESMISDGFNRSPDVLQDVSGDDGFPWSFKTLIQDCKKSMGTVKLAPDPFIDFDKCPCRTFFL